MGYHEYYEYAVTIENLTASESDWFKEVLSDDYDDLNSPLADKFISCNDQYFPAFDYTLNKNSIRCFSETSSFKAGTAQLARVLMEFLDKFRPKERIGFRWVRYDNRGQDTYDGGAFVISADMIESVDLKSWLVSRLEASV
jgi:hypothetical protein